MYSKTKMQDAEGGAGRRGETLLKRNGDAARGLRHRKQFHLEGSSIHVALRGPWRRGREGSALSRHVGVRDAYKGAFMNRVFPATVEASLRIIKGTARLGFDATAKYINSRLLPPLSTPMIQRGRHFDERNLGANKIVPVSSRG